MNISIISQGTEEEGTLSILHYMALINANVDLIIESKLYERIKSNTKQYNNISYTTFTNLNYLDIARKKLLDSQFVVFVL